MDRQYARILSTIKDRDLRTQLEQVLQHCHTAADLPSLADILMPLSSIAQSAFKERTSLMKLIDIFAMIYDETPDDVRHIVALSVPESKSILLSESTNNTSSESSAESSAASNDLAHDASSKQHASVRHSDDTLSGSSRSKRMPNDSIPAQQDIAPAKAHESIVPASEPHVKVETDQTPVLPPIGETSVVQEVVGSANVPIQHSTSISSPRQSTVPTVECDANVNESLDIPSESSDVSVRRNLAKIIGPLHLQNSMLTRGREGSVGIQRGRAPRGGAKARHAAFPFPGRQVVAVDTLSFAEKVSYTERILKELTPVHPHDNLDSSSANHGKTKFLFVNLIKKWIALPDLLVLPFRSLVDATGPSLPAITYRKAVMTALKSYIKPMRNPIPYTNYALPLYVPKLSIAGDANGRVAEYIGTLSLLPVINPCLFHMYSFPDYLNPQLFGYACGAKEPSKVPESVIGDYIDRRDNLYRCCRCQPKIEVLCDSMGVSLCAGEDIGGTGVALFDATGVYTTPDDAFKRIVGQFDLLNGQADNKTSLRRHPLPREDALDLIMLALEYVCNCLYIPEFNLVIDMNKHASLGRYLSFDDAVSPHVPSRANGLSLGQGVVGKVIDESASHAEGDVIAQDVSSRRGQTGRGNATLLPVHTLGYITLRVFTTKPLKQGERILLSPAYRWLQPGSDLSAYCRPDRELPRLPTRCTREMLVGILADALKGLSSELQGFIADAACGLYDSSPAKKYAADDTGGSCNVTGNQEPIDMAFWEPDTEKPSSYNSFFLRFVSIISTYLYTKLSSRFSCPKTVILYNASVLQYLTSEHISLLEYCTRYRAEVPALTTRSAGSQPSGYVVEIVDNIVSSSKMWLLAHRLEPKNADLALLLRELSYCVRGFEEILSCEFFPHSLIACMRSPSSSPSSLDTTSLHHYSSCSNASAGAKAQADASVVSATQNTSAIRPIDLLGVN